MTICQFSVNGTAFVHKSGVPQKRLRGALFELTTLKIKIMIKPLADRVVIEPKPAETQTASGLYIPDTAKEKPQQGTVVAAGNFHGCFVWRCTRASSWDLLIVVAFRFNCCCI